MTGMSARLRGAPAWLPTALLVAVAVAAAWTRVLQARESLWLDELHTAWVAMGSWGQVAARSMAGNQSAPFFALEWALVHTLGASELVLRLPSLVAGVALVGALYALARAWTGSAWIGLVTAWLAAADPQAIYYGTEARPYALVQLLGVLHVALFAELVRHPTVAKRAASVVGAAVLFHLHYTTALVFAGEVAWYAWARLRGRAAYRLRDATIDAAIAAALMAPAVAVLRLLAARRHNWELFVEHRPPWIAILMLPWAATALVATAAVGAWRRVRPPMPTAGRDRGDVARCLVCWLVVPVALAWVSTAADGARLLWPRYLAASAPAAMLLLAVALSMVPAPRVRTAAIATVAALGAVTSPSVRMFIAQGRLLDWRTDDWRDAVAWFNQEPGHGTGAVLLRSTLIESGSDATGTGTGALDRAYALYPLRSLYRADAADDRLVPLDRARPAALDDGTLGRLSRDGAAWLVYGGSEEGEREAAAGICRQLQQRSGRPWAVRASRSFGTVHVARLGPPG